MKGKTYTFFIASTPGKLKKLIVPAYVLHALAVLALIGSITVVAAAGSYTRLLWKVGNYNALRHDQDHQQAALRNPAQDLLVAVGLLRRRAHLPRGGGVGLNGPRVGGQRQAQR